MARTASPVVRRRWQQLVGGFDGRVETVAEYCDRNQVSTTSYYKWKRKLSNESEPGGEAVAARKQNSAFLPVQIDRVVQPSDSAVSVQLGEIRVDVPVDQKWLLFELIDHLSQVDSDRVQS